ncbi:formate dehydrogenase subunit alpha [Vogesella indigofera]|uniref:Formate dehydrogenase subunit alpha n=1 Tax=Vogesella indigofera TaxID=45465 RepID=A0ABT5I330_VOGIN|nr:formate dehydrogenase subunit alpha [Vogesella indigofera]MDC7690433.1 formate dehydrogenase subunit alpha [Vogesella indigofera]
MPRLILNGQAHDVPAGTLLLDALAATGSQVAQLCHDPRLAPSGGCRLCLVAIDGQPLPQPACATRAEDGMVVQSHTPALEALRRSNLQLLAERYPAGAVTTQPELPFHALLRQYHIQPGGKVAGNGFRDDSHPYIGVDMDRCIHCQRCVRICDEVQGQFVWAEWGRGEHTRIATAHGNSMLADGCVSCGACVDSCPSGALFDKPAIAAQQWTRTTCGYCGVGCQMDAGSADGRVVAVRPAQHPVNRGHLCLKGRYGFEFNHAADRVTQPMIKQHGEWQPVGWDEALSFVANRLLAIRGQHGPDAIGVLGSARASNEENYLAQKFARVVIGSNNVDCCARVCHTPSAKALKTMLGTGAATNHFDDIEQARTLLLCGCNPTENHPVIGARIKQAVLHGARLVVIDPRRTELAAMADLHLAVRPGHNVPLLNAMAATLIEEGLLDRDFIATRVSGYAELADFLRDYRPERVANGCGVAAADIRAAARLYATQGPAMCLHGLGVTEHLQGTEGVMCLINLALLSGNLGKPGSGINPLRGQNNVQGAAHMGCDPVTLTGAQSFADAGERFAAHWGTPLPKSRGLDLMQMMDAARDGRLKALWAIGYDIYLTLANEAATATALAQMELVIVQDLFLNETARRFGHVFLPAASFLEKDGTFMNADRRVQHIRQVVPPPGDALPDWQIICRLAAAMGQPAGFDFADPQAIWNEIRALWPAGAGLSYARLAQESLHWPCPDEQHPGTPVLHSTQFATSQTATLACIPFLPSSEQPDEDYPLLLVTGRVLTHFNAGTMSYRGRNALLRPSDTLDMVPADAARLGLQQGERVLLHSRYGSAVLPLNISEAQQPGQLFASFHRPDLLLNRLTSAVRDRLVHSPEYKLTAVRVEKLAD